MISGGPLSLRPLCFTADIASLTVVMSFFQINLGYLRELKNISTTTTTQRARKENLQRETLAPFNPTVDMDMPKN